MQRRVPFGRSAVGTRQAGLGMTSPPTWEGGSLGRARTIPPCLGKPAFVHALACCGGLVQVKSLRVSARSTFCFYSKHVLFLLEARSASTRSTARTASSRCTCKCVLPCQNMSDGAWPLPRGTGSGQIMTKGRIQILVQVYSQKCWRMVLFYYLCNLNIHTIYISFNTL